MPKLIKDGAIAIDDWVMIDDSVSVEELPAGKLIVPLALWAEQQESLLKRDEELGLWLKQRIARANWRAGARAFAYCC